MGKLTEHIREVVKFIIGAVQDPITLGASSSRGIAWGCAIVGWIISIHSVYHNNVTASIVALVTALVGQGAVAIMNRTTKEQAD